MTKLLFTEFFKERHPMTKTPKQKSKRLKGHLSVRVDQAHIEALRARGIDVAHEVRAYLALLANPG